MHSPMGKTATSYKGWIWILLFPLPSNFSNQLSLATPQYLKIPLC